MYPLVKVLDICLYWQEYKNLHLPSKAIKAFKKSDNYKQVIADYQETSALRAKLKQQREEDDKQK